MTFSSTASEIELQWICIKRRVVKFLLFTEMSDGTASTCSTSTSETRKRGRPAKRPGYGGGRPRSASKGIGENLVIYSGIIIILFKINENAR